MSKTNSKTNSEPASMARLRSSIETALTAMNGVLDAVNAVCAELSSQDKQTAVQRPAPGEPAKKAAQGHAGSRKKAAAAKTPAEKPTTGDSAGKPTAPTPHHRLPKSVRLTPHEITLNIGSQPVRELAENDAKDFLNNPKVFWYRPTQFPDPKRYGVQPHVEAVKVVQRADPKFTRAPWTVSLTVSLIGDDKKCDSWGRGVYDKNKGDQE